jgi:hypothetical protein
MTNGRKPADDQIPDLVIGPTPTSSRQKRSPQALEPLGFELEFEGISSNALDLSIAVPATDSVSSASQPWPSALTPARVDLDAEQLQRASPYGEPPEHLFETPVYAWLVYREQTKLKRELAAAQLRLEAAEHARDATLATWASAVRLALEQDPRFARMFEGLKSEETGLDAANRDLERARAEVARDQQESGNEGGELQRRIAATDEQCEAQSRLCADAERALAREHAKRKRIDIEARAGTALDAATLEARIAEADSAALAVSEQLGLCRQNLAAAERNREAARLELRRLEDRKKRAGYESAQEQQRVQRELAATQRTLTVKQADIGRAVLALRERKYLDDSTRGQLLQHDAEVLSLCTEHQSLMVQLDSFDRQAVRRGLWLAIGTLALGLLLALLRLVC